MERGKGNRKEGLSFGDLRDLVDEYLENNLGKHSVFAAPALSEGRDLSASFELFTNAAERNASRLHATSNRIVEFLFATTRVPKNTAQRITFTHQRNSALTLGAARVSVPEDHKLGRIELPHSYRLFGLTLIREQLARIMRQA